nr:DUF1134 domain-containing protein [Stakelama marina]
MRKAWLIGLLAVFAAAAPATAQVRTVDPNNVIDGDLATQQNGQSETTPTTPYTPQSTTPYTPPASDPYTSADNQTAAPSQPTEQADPYAPAPQNESQNQPAPAAPQQSYPTNPTGPTPGETTQSADTYKRDDLIGAAEGVFGKGAAGLAEIIQKILSDQGEPNAYIAGREASGAFIFGLRYGSGIMHHRIEGERPVYWTGPSVGFDVGGDAAKVFVLVYNLYDTQELYKRFPQAEGRVYFVGGFSASYLRSGNVVLIPVRMGVGWRLGANIGYMKFTEKQRWLPF